VAGFSFSGGKLQAKKRVYAFFDGQNLFHSAKECFGYTKPNYDPIKLAIALTELEKDRMLIGLNFYTGVHSSKVRLDLNQFWHKRLEALKHRGKKFGIQLKIISRPLKYTMIDDIKNPGQKYPLPREKGIDVRMALDLVRLARYRQFDVAIIFSQDTDLIEAVHEVFALGRELGVKFFIERAFPGNPDSEKQPIGIRDTRWRIIDKALYDSCLDPDTDLYFPKPPMFKNP